MKLGLGFVRRVEVGREWIPSGCKSLESSKNFQKYFYNGIYEVIVWLILLLSLLAKGKARKNKILDTN